ncbi:glycoside hydrolase family 127 protein [Nibricoccus aquaticus]|nr:glycoside hydrolase family 127 protein [Nibricoccus aquaticus]
MPHTRRSPRRAATFAALTAFALTLLPSPTRATSVDLSQQHTGKPLEFFPLTDVRLLDGPFKHAQDLNRAYLLALDPDRLLAPFRTSVGLEPKAPKYPNWESTGLDGHTAGHVVTALAQMVADTGDTELRRRLDYMIAEFAACQAASGDGYVGAVPDGKKFWDEIRAGKIDATNFSINGRWVPWYNLHKLFAGLREAWLITKNEQARDVLIRLSDWCDALFTTLTDDQIQTMLRCEHGGMNEVLADVAAITGDTKYLKLARRFSHREILDPLLRHEDKLTGLHANTQIPKAIGFARIGELDNDTAWLDASRFFWDTVVTRRSVAIGGDSVREHFHPSDDFSSMIESREGPETCNTYNLLRLSEQLFRLDPLARYADYYERALFNHILSSQHPQHGGFVYFTPMRPRHYRVYSQPETSFWCCVGSGLESHGKYAHFIYAHQGEALFVNLFIASSLNWKSKGVTVTQETKFPDEGRSTLTVRVKKPTRFSLRIRIPAWADRKDFSVSMGDLKRPTSFGFYSQSYSEITREWHDGDRVEIILPMRTTLERLPDGSDYAAILHGPIVLAAKTGTESLDGLRADDSRMGHVAPGPYLPLDSAPTLVGNEKTFASKITPVPGKSLTFTARELLRPDNYRDLQLVPFSRIHDARYLTYFRVATPERYTELTAQLAAEEKARNELETRTLDRVIPGEQQPEVEHAFAGEATNTGSHLGRRWRDASKWFSYQLKIPAASALVSRPRSSSDSTVTAVPGFTADTTLELRVTYFAAERGRHFDIVVNDRVIATVSLDGHQHDRFTDVAYPIPADLIRETLASDARTLTVKFRAAEKSRTASIYDLRLLRP